MTEEQEQALIEYCQEEVRLKAEHIARLENHMPGQFDLTRYQLELQTAEIALAALTAQPVKLPKGFSPGIGDLFDKAAPVMRRDSKGGKWLHKAVVTQMLNELGYEVQE
ncbi:hypothetical protein LZU96_15205 [Pantoea agglomerans]|uniref:hypothetical protein n=1 Tax=Enterobacter agglomerans TaxID=549 RepID=UPI001F1CDBF5|nr:hypothetical protein [Pantoea agglomerans]UIL51565.1 hypothetical protein LZU96_15205 [Pantoea agglomerans]